MSYSTFDSASGAFSVGLKSDSLSNFSGDQDSGINLATNDTIKFDIANSTKWTMNSSGNLFPSSTSQGIVLGATSDTAANRLDDYEEGSYTPAFRGSDTAGSVAYSSNYGYYTKIGNMCRVFVDLTVSSASSMVGTAGVELPFNAKNETNHYAYSVFWQVGGNFMSISSRKPAGYVNANDNKLWLYQIDLPHDAFSNFAMNTTGRISFQVIYATA